MTLYKAITRNKPEIDYIKTLGSLIYILNPKIKRDNKLDNKSIKGILVGFESSNNYLIYIPSQDKIISSRDIIIKEDLSYNEPNNTTINNDLILLNDLSLDYNIIKPYINNSQQESIISNNQNQDQDQINDQNIELGELETIRPNSPTRSRPMVFISPII